MLINLLRKIVDDKEFIHKFKTYLNTKNTKETNNNEQSHLLENLNPFETNFLLKNKLPDLRKMLIR